MPKPVLALLCAVSALFGCAASGTGTAPALLVLDHATLLDGESPAALPDRTIEIAGGRIRAVYPSGSRPLPEGAERMDLRGRYVMPGMIDAHVHLQTQERPDGMIGQILANVLRGGVTTVRDMGGNGAALTPLAAAARDGTAESPQIVYASLLTGPQSQFWLSGPVGAYVSRGAAPGTQDWFRQVASGADVDGAVAAARRHGAAGVKLHSGFDAALLRRLGSAARARGLRVWAHAYGDPARPSEVAAVASIMSHADMLAYEGLRARPEGFAALPYVQRTRIAMAATPTDGEALGRLFALMRRNQVCLEPTLFVMQPRQPNPAMVDYLRYVAAATARAHREGVTICAGTDAIGGATPNLPAELALLIERAGLSPMQAIQAATRNNAAALGLADRGRVAPGLRADLVILTADPTADIANLRRIEAVIHGGRIVRPARRGEDE